MEFGLKSKFDLINTEVPIVTTTEAKPGCPSKKVNEKPSIGKTNMKAAANINEKPINLFDCCPISLLGLPRLNKENPTMNSQSRKGVRKKDVFGEMLRIRIHINSEDNPKIAKIYLLIRR
jgi:hypothetical protein